MMALTLHQVFKETKNRLSKAFYFAAERRTGIVPTPKIVSSDRDAFCEGSIVTANWEGKKVQAKILALRGKFNSRDLSAIKSTVPRFLYIH